RYFVAFAVAFRFWLHKPQYTANQWSTRVVIIVLFIVATAVSTYVTLVPLERRRLKTFVCGLIFADIAFISIAYWLTNNPESDFFLFYYLPIFAAVEYLDRKLVAAVSVAVCAELAIVVFLMIPMADAPWTFEGLLWRVFIPRAI